MKRATGGEWNLLFVGVWLVLTVANAMVGHWSTFLLTLTLAFLNAELWLIKSGRWR